MTFTFLNILGLITVFSTGVVLLVRLQKELNYIRKNSKTDSDFKLEDSENVIAIEKSEIELKSIMAEDTKMPDQYIKVQDLSGFITQDKPVAMHTTSVCANRPFMPGEVMHVFAAGFISSEGTIFSQKTAYTLQIDTNKHIGIQPEIFQHINHGCEPNVFFNATTMQLISLQMINIGDELKRFLPASEWEIAQSFICHCGSPLCLGRITGAKSISTEILRRYRLNDFILEKIRQRDKTNQIVERG